MLDPRASFSRRNQGMRFALYLATLLAWTATAHAETVAILRPSSPSAEATQVLTLLRGELLSVGIEVTIADQASAHRAGETDSVAWLEPFAKQGMSAVVEAIAGDNLEAVDVWLVKAHPQRFEVTRVVVDPTTPAQPAVLALRAVEVLRAGLLQTDWASRRRRNERVAEVQPVALPITTAQVPAGAGERVGLELGAVGVTSLDGLGPAVLPTLQIGWAARQWLILQASVAGMGSRSTVETSIASARVAQQYAVLGARYRARPDRRLWPFLGLAAGVLHTTVEGQGGPGKEGHTAERWSGLLDASLGAGLRVYGHSYLTLAAHAQIAAPYVAVSFLDRTAATSGRPNLLLSLTVGAWL
jgi:hypothetical protein